MTAPITKRILRLARQKQIVRPRDFPEFSNPTVYLNRLVERGELIRLARGIYAPADLEPSPHHSLVEACKRLPSGVICLLSALSFHGFTTQNPGEVWMAFSSNFTPSSTDVPIRPVRMSGAAFSYGVEEHLVQSVPVRVYSAAKTVADCFKFRNKIGLDVAQEALREGWRERRFSLDELWQAAQVCRIQAVLRPYAEMLVS